MMRKTRYILAIVIGCLLVSVGVYIQYKNEQKILIEAKQLYATLLNVTNENLDKEQISELEKQIENIKLNTTEKQNLQENITDLNQYKSLKEKLDSLYSNVEFANVDLKTLNDLEKDYNKLNVTFQENLKELFEKLSIQKKHYENINFEISELFVDSSKTKLNENVTMNKIEDIKQKLLLLGKIDYVKEKSNDLDIAINLINEEKIKNTNEWIFLNVPYINQNNNKVYNGCEAACLLMGLQYKKYLKGVTLNKIATDMPKSSNAYEGFTYDIFSFEPKNVAHWIAPNALASFGRSYSGNLNVIDATGYSIDQLNNEISNNNPVIIYITNNFDAPKNWSGGAPQNLHVVLLSGYNEKTKEQIITDPGGITDSNNIKIVSKSKLEKVYNQVGKKAVIIR